MRRQTTILVLLIISAAMTACAPAAEFPTGSFYVAYEGTGHGVAKGEGAVFTFSEDGTFTVLDSAGVLRISGTYAVKGDEYTELRGLTTCEAAGPGTYRWAFDGQSLTFTGIGKDECVYRTELLDGRTFTLRE